MIIKFKSLYIFGLVLVHRLLTVKGFGIQIVAIGVVPSYIIQVWHEKYDVTVMCYFSVFVYILSPFFDS